MQSVSLLKIQRLLVLVSLVSFGHAQRAQANWWTNCCDPPRAYHTPECHPTWGYHQTCWRKFPPLQPCAHTGDYCPTGGCPTCGPNGATLPQNYAPTYSDGNVIYDGQLPLQVPQQNAGMTPPQNFAVPTYPNTVPPMPTHGQPFMVPQQQQPAAAPTYPTPGTPQPIPSQDNSIPANPPVQNAPPQNSGGDAFAPNALQPLPLDPTPMDQNSLPPAGQTSVLPGTYGRPAAPVRPVARTMSSRTSSGLTAPMPPPAGAYPTAGGQPYAVQQPIVNGLPQGQFMTSPQSGMVGPQGTIVYPMNGEVVADPTMRQRVVGGLKHFRDELFHKPNPEPVYRDTPATHVIPGQPNFGQPVKSSLWSRVKPW
ncbi:MAG: hypothetical protein Fues2KO_53530 [Fuerstiella sp.]